MTVAELLHWIAEYQTGVYALLLGYCLAKTGPLPMVAGYASASGALQLSWVLVTVLVGTVLGAQLRFALGRRFSPWLYRSFPKLALWMALGSAGVEQYGHWVFPFYRCSKGTFTLVGLGAGASALSWQQFSARDLVGALLWASTMVNMGFLLGSIGKAMNPEWAAYVGVALLCAGMLAMFVFGKRLKARLLPLAEKALADKRTRYQTSA